MDDWTNRLLAGNGFCSSERDQNIVEWISHSLGLGAKIWRHCLQRSRSYGPKRDCWFYHRLACLVTHNSRTTGANRTKFGMLPLLDLSHLHWKFHRASTSQPGDRLGSTSNRWGQITWSTDMTCKFSSCENLFSSLWGFGGKVRYHVKGNFSASPTHQLWSP